MTSPETLKNRIIQLIIKQGPISISHFMDLCLNDEVHGYYHHANPFGIRGDFITAPETSQMFGEILGLWSVAAWQQIGAPADFVFCETGPGRGTLMDDMLRTIKQLAPEFLTKSQIILVETSQKLRNLIIEKLSTYEITIRFITKIDDLPPRPLILIGNEWLDCLPIHQYRHEYTGWHERLVTLNKMGDLCFTTHPTPIDPTKMPLHALSAPIGSYVEISPQREILIEQLGHHIKARGGAVLLIDYGSLEHGFGDTLQAISKHEFQHPLTAPGRHDLTSHVDFATLDQCARQTGCISASMTQGAFLTKLGIENRAERLSIGRDRAFQQKIMSELERLTAAHEMGNLFKTFCLSQPDCQIFPFLS